MSNPFSKFVNETKKIKVEALGAEVEIRCLTVAETDAFAKAMIGEDNGTGKVNFRYDMLADIRKQKVATALVNPKLTIEEINALPSTAAEAINEIADAIDDFNNQGKKKN